MLSVSIGVATISLLREADLVQGVDTVSIELRGWIVAGIITVTGLVVVILNYIVGTNVLLRRLNEPETEEQ